MKGPFLLILLLSFVNQNLACSCTGTASFCKTAEWAENIVKVKVGKKYKIDNSHYTFIDLEVEEVLLSNQAIDLKHLTLSTTGTSCDIDIHANIKEGQNLLITFRDTFQVENATHPAISFWQCGIYFLEINDGILKGDITEVNENFDQRISYRQIKKNIGNLCTLNFIDAKDVYINSLIDNGQLLIKNMHTSPLEYRIFDAAGRLVIEGNIDNEEEKEVNMHNASAGMYFINLRSPLGQITKKFIRS